MRSAAPLTLVAAAVAGGCTSQWFPGYAHPDIAKTDLVIHTEPTGATLLMDGTKLGKPAPVRLPIEYAHVDTLYERQSNYGVQMREDMGPVLTVLTFPVWLVASFFHFTEQKHRHTYGHNTFVVTAYAPGREDAEITVVLEGEAEKQIVLKLPPKYE